MTEKQDDPKIIVDDDWKQQVQKEKEALSEEAAESNLPPMPEASFSLLVTTLTTQALSAMGFIPDPISGKTTANLAMAKHFIDTLGILEGKTSGNLDDDEKQLLNESLHQLRMAFVMAGQSSVGDSGPEDSSGPSIELP